MARGLTIDDLNERAAGRSSDGSIGAAAGLLFRQEEARGLQGMGDYPQYAQVTEKIEALLRERTGKSFTLYLQDDYGRQLWQVLEEDVKKGSRDVEHLASVYEGLETKAFTSEEESGDEEPGVFPTLRNNLFFYAQRGVALAQVPVFRRQGLDMEDFIWAEDDDCMKGFTAYVRDRRRDTDRRRVTVFTDTREGLEIEKMSITRGVGRDEVVMDAALKTEIFRSIDEFFAGDRQFFRDYGIPYKRGLLLYGRPGNGKTTLVKSIAGSVQAPVAYWQITEHTSSYSVQQVFSNAVSLAPMVLVIEDIDSMPENVRSFFLNTLDGATSKEGVFLIGTTNYPERIDPALMNRAGRFDRAYEIRLPDEAQRLHYLTLKRLGELCGEEALAAAARGAEGFSFAQLNELYVSAAFRMHYEKRVDIAQLVQEMRSDLGRAASQVWHSADAPPKVGFR
ncbi:AAA family ATPase [Paenibacillus mucilaginosus]|uniref:ATPase n=2 Tax=Paenibacillus mucilaginosus TaxID=61624 RepID=H6NKR8_9BACL|nr:ATP-binding protein [Paenibacillus mucilaginosus]AEI45501.1 ATPase possibly involved in protein degradation [Paenibacillus mucilaginosus KNP414]AFC33205.1 ATPase [Paenibacillus mucilaginosus 3016]MCG7215257.1 ATP-binding protein [Paenibacillus mucilaginosus]WDM26925.1 ATP-binding protein [Paenibacillus mucilaginosus]WFA21637.1 ATP-binding protein [Paenibacillus mucilaginosus]